MKIALVVPGFSSDDADWCIPVLVDVVKGLTREVEVHVFALRYPHRAGTYTAHGARIHAVGGANISGVHRLGMIGATIRLVREEHGRDPFDLIHGIWADEPGFVAAAVGQMLGLPSVVSVMGGELVELPDIAYGGRLSRANRVLTSLAFRWASTITAASRRCVDSISRVVRTTQESKVIQMLWGIDPSVFEAHESSRIIDGSFRILSVGSLVPVKDHAMLLEAFAAATFKTPQPHLHVVGDGPERPALERRARDLGIAQRVTFHGHVRRQHLEAFYRQADLLVISSCHEMQPAVILEAALFGVPAVGAEVGIVPEFPALAAPAVPVSSASRLADAIEQASYRSDLGCVGDSARRHVLSNALSGMTVARLMDLYAALVSTTSQRRTFIGPLAPVRSKAATMPYLGAGQGRLVTGPTVTVLIDTYNYGRFIARAVDSVIAQTYPESKIEILVVDDGSTDGTSDVVAKYGARVTYIWKHSGGQASALNQGFRTAQGDIICLLDADDVFYPEKVRRVADVAIQNPRVGLIYNEFDILTGGEKWPKTTPEPTWTGFRIPFPTVKRQIKHLISLGHPWTATTSAMSLRRNVAQKAVIPENLFIHSPDVFLGLVLPFMTDIEVITTPLTGYVYHGDNIGLFRSSRDNQLLHRRQLATSRNFVESITACRFLRYGGRSIYSAGDAGYESTRSKWIDFKADAGAITRADVPVQVRTYSYIKLLASGLFLGGTYSLAQRGRTRVMGLRSRPRKTPTGPFEGPRG